jgi:hypothetical protein
MFQVIFAVLAVVAASVHLAISSQSRGTAATIARTYLLYLLFVYVGLMGVLTAYAHVFRPVETSASIGWSTSPYEYEVGMVDLTVGVLGILCVWFRGNFWLATAVANSVWLLGDAVGHMRQMVINNNHAANNSGIFLVAEIVTPLVILFLALYQRFANMLGRALTEKGWGGRSRTWGEPRVNRKRCGRTPSRYCNLAYSALASLRMGMSGSASFQ